MKRTREKLCRITFFCLVSEWMDLTFDVLENLLNDQTFRTSLLGFWLALAAMAAGSVKLRIKIV
jgi:hypothetical protein